jgi:branched-chain amino acid transport system permease protein
MSGELIFIANMLTIAGIYAMLAMVLNMEAGWGGLWDLGLAGFFAVGAYTYVITTSPDQGLTLTLEWPMAVGILAGAAVVAVIALVIGASSLRLRGEYFLIATFAFAEVIRQLITNTPEFTSGSAGFNSIDRPLEGVADAGDYTYVLFLLVLLATVGVYLFTRRLGKAPLGYGLRAVRDNEALALTLGKQASRRRLQVFVLSATFVGLLGPLYVWYTRSLFPSMFTSDVTFTVWTALVIGGIGSIAGPAVGAVLLICAVEATQFLQVSPEHAGTISSARPVIIGVALILILRYRPQGLLTERRSFRTGALASEPAERGASTR